MDPRGPVATIACARCGDEQLPQGDRMRTCAACGLVFDATKASTQAIVPRRRIELQGTEEITLAIREHGGLLAFVLGVAGSVALLVGFAAADDTTYTMALCMTVALVLLVVAIQRTLPVRIHVTPTELVARKEWGGVLHLPRATLKLDADGDRHCLFALVDGRPRRLVRVASTAALQEASEAIEAALAAVPEDAPTGASSR